MYPPASSPKVKLIAASQFKCHVNEVKEGQKAAASRRGRNNRGLITPSMPGGKSSISQWLSSTNHCWIQCETALNTFCGISAPMLLGLECSCWSLLPITPFIPCLMAFNYNDSIMRLHLQRGELTTALWESSFTSQVPAFAVFHLDTKPARLYAPVLGQKWDN